MSHSIGINEIAKLGFESIEDLFSERGILELLNNKFVKAEFIPGEKLAFEELIKEVKNAKESLRTTRFANQSIVTGERKNSDIHNEFMNALYEASNKDLKICDRIVCNNEPNKWDDILQVLVKSDSKMRVFVVQGEYRTGFELVIIDEKTAFIHFYQIDNHGDHDKNGDRYTHEVEVINSTLKIQGETVCKKLANIFDRLHHIDFDTECKNPSRTLLGIPKKDTLNDEETLRGVFQLDNNLSTKNNTGNERRKADVVIKSFIEAFNSWEFENKKDREYMAIGIALLDREFKNTISEYFKDDTERICKEIDKRIN